jgi:hypothetical protein
MPRWRLRVTLLLTAICSGCFSSWQLGSAEAVPAASTSLSANQFQGVAGTSQIGPSFPDFAGKQQVAVRSVFLVETDALSAMNAFLDRARDLGFMQLPNMSSGYCTGAPYGPASDAPPPGQARVLCEGRYGRPDGTLVTINIDVCESCPEPQSTAIVVLDKAKVRDLSPIIGLEPISKTLALSPDVLRSVRTPTNETLRLGEFPTVKHVRLAVPVLSETSLCAITWVALVRVHGNPATAFKVYEAQMFGNTGQGRSYTRGSRRLTQRSDPEMLLTLVEAPTLRHPWMLASRCEPTLD